MKLKTMSAALLLTLPFWACAKDVTIIYTNDLHAHVEPYKVPWMRMVNEILAVGRISRRW